MRRPISGLLVVSSMRWLLLNLHSKQQITLLWQQRSSQVVLIGFQSATQSFYKSLFSVCFKASHPRDLLFNSSCSIQPCNFDFKKDQWEMIMLFSRKKKLKLIKSWKNSSKEKLKSNREKNRWENVRLKHKNKRLDCLITSVMGWELDNHMNSKN